MCGDGCNEGTIVPIGPTGAQGPVGPQGPVGVGSAVTVKDAQGHTVLNASEIRFTDSNAILSNPATGIAEVKFIPPSTQWIDIQNLPYYTTGSESFKPQYTIDGNKIVFRGFLYIPLFGAPAITNTDAYLNVPGATTDDTKMSVVTNATAAIGIPQGRFFTTSVGSLPNLPLSATPIARDITFSNLPAYRRYEFGSPARVALYRTNLILKIGALNTTFKNVATSGAGCIMMFSPKVDEFTNGGGIPLGNDPLALVISNTNSGNPASNYVASKDNFPFTVASSGVNDPFTVDAHDIASLGGFIINLEGLSGYLN